MTAPAAETRTQSTITETCRCGASTTITTTRLADARRQLDGFLARHGECLSRSPVGFRSPAPPDPWAPLPRSR